MTALRTPPVRRADYYQGCREVHEMQLILDDSTDATSAEFSAQLSNLGLSLAVTQLVAPGLLKAANARR